MAINQQILLGQKISIEEMDIIFDNLPDRLSEVERKNIIKTIDEILLSPKPKALQRKLFLEQKFTKDLSFSLEQKKTEFSHYFGDLLLMASIGELEYFKIRGIIKFEALLKKIGSPKKLIPKIADLDLIWRLINCNTIYLESLDGKYRKIQKVIFILNPEEVFVVNFLIPFTISGKKPINREKVGIKFNGKPLDKGTAYSILSSAYFGSSANHPLSIILRIIGNRPYIKDSNKVIQEVKEFK
ncbi:MAG: hypothetical protein AAFR87_27950 [Bacteroidota bacterium]